ncbi:squalene synthase HpnC [Novosphingobium sp. SG751A]|uniref:squalene synthase HpnC n=1 Tax=Novosphingobium sp. SG751A TaxID=2587000 RepID=UPI001551CF9C|nr:squalene synthase HpnC [Novosphingobium sp. SG751A]NOW46247.1 squalene synthase HpnC [Novosphingobium sp. SG751A]
MTDTILTTADLQSGKDHTGENFPVASFLVRPDARAPVMAYYRFARAADDIADHPTAPPAEKLRLLGLMRAGLEGGEAGIGDPLAQALGTVCRERGISLAHAHDLLTAFERDCTIDRYQDWAGLIDYCRYSAMPVGRFVLDCHGEDRVLWPMNDSLCAALQIINHLQDCAKDYRAIDRVYIPLDSLRAAGIGVEALAEKRANPALRGVLTDLTLRTQGLLRASAPFADAIRDWRLAAEVAIIQRLAQDLCEVLLARDPLSEKVHHTKGRALTLALRAAMRQAGHRIWPG